VLYRVCDVADSAQVEALIEEARSRFGSVAGIVHGPACCEMPSSVSLLPRFCPGLQGQMRRAANLFAATCDQGLEFFATFSSLAAYQGNVGQVGYCAANRMLATMFAPILGACAGGAIQDPVAASIAGAGMADDPEIREILSMRSLDAAYMDLEELARFFEFEMFLNEARDDWVMPARFIPKAPTVTDLGPTPDSVSGSRVCSDTAGDRPWPFIDAVESYHAQAGRITTVRTFSLETDRG